MNVIKTCINKIAKKIFILGMIMAIILPLCLHGTVTAQADETVLKIGYDFNSNFIKDNNNEYYGYGVEYLEKIAEYTDWEYEYVKDSSWQESLEKLRNGEIDLICTAHYTEERAKEFLYSDIPLGYETTLLYTTTDSKLTYQDYEAMNGQSVGLLQESYSAKEFVEYTQEHGIDCTLIYFQQENDMLTALSAGQIDMMAIGSRYATPNLKMLDRLGANAFYCIANKGNEALIKEIEDTLQQIMFDDPKFEGELNEEYFGHHSISNTPLYTKEEVAFIENHEPIKVKIMMNQRPSCYIENGEAKGIWVEYLKLLSEKSGIQFEVEAGASDEYSEETYDELLKQGYMILRTERSRAHNNRNGDNITTSPLAEVNVSYVIRQENVLEELKEDLAIGLTIDLAYVEGLLSETHSKYQFIYYDDAQGCMEALANKEVDIIVQNQYKVSYLMQKPEYADTFTEIPGATYEDKVLLVADEEQQVVIDILNKAINHISEDEKENIVSKELLLNPYVIGLGDIWYQYWGWIVSGVVGIVIILAIYVVMTQRTMALKIKQNEYELLEKQLEWDELTGLYNRSAFFEKVRVLLDNTEEEMCIVMMNILNFKVINELYGMVAGDYVLKEVGNQLLKIGEEKSLIMSRFMADYYFICIPKAEFEKITLPSKLETSLEEVEVRVVYGVFLIGDEKNIPINVMCDRANTAAHDKEYKYTEYVHFYNEDERKERILIQEIEREMERAVKNREFAVYVQPKYDVVSMKIVGGEALVRWIHPKKGMVSPGIFIKVFEKNGFIVQLDYYIWEETCRLQAKLKAEGVSIVPISINVSRAHFYGTELKNKLMELINKYGLETKDIELEITESICGDDSDSIYDLIRDLQYEGFKIAMDDFGSGYSSLNMLKDMPLDIIKMDLKFLDSDDNELKSHYILKSLIDLARAIDLKVVVEGVETEAQVEFLKQFFECYAQGYYFSRPVETSIYEEMLIKYQEEKNSK